jgi:hypothetical protein
MTGLNKTLFSLTESDKYNQRFLTMHVERFSGSLGKPQKENVIKHQTELNVHPLL